MYFVAREVEGDEKPAPFVVPAFPWLIWLAAIGTGAAGWFGWKSTEAVTSAVRFWVNVLLGCMVLWLLYKGFRATGGW